MTKYKPLLGFALAVTLELSLPNQAHAAEACGQAPSAFERVDPGDDESGIGGTGILPHPGAPPTPRAPFVARGDDESGIGGTGRAPAPSGGGESGIGGTGIFGTVLRVDPLCVNGFEIQAPATVKIESALGGDAQSGLNVGQIVFVRALRTDSSLIAQRVQIQRDLAGAPWSKGPPLDLLSIEGFVSDGPHGPQLGGFRLDFGSSSIQPEARDLRPGTRVRATGRPESGGTLRIATLPRPPRNGDVDRIPRLPSHPHREDDTRDTQPVRPEPILKRPERADPQPRPERPEVRPDGVRPERPLPRVIERPEMIERPARR